MVRSKLRKASLLPVEGLDFTIPAEYIGDRFSPNNQNFRAYRGLLRKRNGSSAFGATLGERVMAGREFNREGTLFNIRIGLDEIERYDSGSSAWVNIHGTVLTGGIEDLVDTAVPLLSGKRILVITNGIDNMRQWTGTGNTTDLGGSPPVARFIQEYKTYLVAANIAGGVDVTQRVQWSDTAQPNVWSGGNSGAVDLIEDGDDITALTVFSDFLCVHKRSSIYLGSLVSSGQVFRFERKNTRVGTVASNSIVNLPTGEQIFLATDGLRVFNGIQAPLIDAPINDEIRESLNPNHANKAWGVLVRELDEVWIGVPLGSQEVGETVYRFNYLTRRCFKDSRANINAAWRFTQGATFTSWDDTPGTWDSQTTIWNEGSLNPSFPVVMFGDTTGITTSDDDTALDDNGTDINAFFESKDFESDFKGQLSRWQRMELWARGASVDIDYSTDRGETWTFIDTYPLSSSFPTDAAPINVWFDVVSTKIRFRFRSESDGLLDIKQFIPYYQPRELRI